MWDKVQGDAVHPPKALQSALSALSDLELRAQIYIFVCIFHQPI